MKIHEYQGKQLLKDFGVAVPRGIVVRSADEASVAYKTLGGDLAVLKSQIHAGGRGKGRFKEEPEQPGVTLVRSPEEAMENAKKMLGNTLVTIQTGEEGKRVGTLYLEEGLEIERELYLAVVVDREIGSPMLIISSEGGMDIEEVAESTPEKILSEPFDAAYGLHTFQAVKLAFQLGLEGPAIRSAAKFLPKFCEFFLKQDCDMAKFAVIMKKKETNETV